MDDVEHLTARIKELERENQDLRHDVGLWERTTIKFQDALDTIRATMCIESKALTDWIDAGCSDDGGGAGAPDTAQQPENQNGIDGMPPGMRRLWARMKEASEELRKAGREME